LHVRSQNMLVQLIKMQLSYQLLQGQTEVKLSPSPVAAAEVL
jgi:hypothetical protein